MEGVFSSSMYVSSNQMCKSKPPKAGHQLFISPLKELAVGHFQWAENGGTGRYQVSTGRSTPCVRCTGVGHMSLLKFACQFLTVTCGSPDALQVHTGLMRRELRKPQGHRTLSTGIARCSPD